MITVNLRYCSGRGQIQDFMKEGGFHSATSPPPPPPPDNFENVYCEIRQLDFISFIFNFS